MKKTIFVMLMLSAISSWAQNFEWARRAGLWAYDYGNGAATDNAGNVYIAGKYEYNAQFSGVTLPCQGNHDIYVAKYNAGGGLVWIRSAGGYSGDYATCVSTDSRFVYVGGEIQGSNAYIKFVGSPISLRCQGSNDIMLAKYDVYGNLIWARRAGGWDDEKALAITHDNAGNVYVCGRFLKYATFGNVTVSSRGNWDFFIAKYDANGNFKWVRKGGSPGRDEARAIKCDAAGNVYVTGMHNNDCRMDWASLYVPNGQSNCFLAKYDTWGGLKWAKTAGGNWDDLGWGVTVDNAGKIFVAGEFNADANFSGQHLYTTGQADIFVACYNSSGGIIWTRKAGGRSVDRARAIATDGSNLFITGQFGGSAQFGGTTRWAADQSDIFVAALNNGGGFMWATSVGGPADKPEDLGYESGNAIAVFGNSVYATGAMLDGGQFGGTYLSPYTRTDVFLTKVRSGWGKEADEGNELPVVSADLQFMAEPVGNEVDLKWSYAARDKEFILEKSMNEESFDIIKNYCAGEGERPTNYTHKDTRFTSKDVYYRLRLVDMDGVTEFSPLLKVAADVTAAGIDIFPNPAHTDLSINVKNNGDKKLLVAVYDAAGREVWQEEVLNGCCKVDVSPWSRGVYVVVIRNDEAVISRKKILVQ